VSLHGQIGLCKRVQKGWHPDNILVLIKKFGPWLDKLELMISSTSYFCSPLTSIGEGGFETHLGMVDAW
jgi:hypothetical protein